MYRVDVEFEVRFEVKRKNFRNDDDRYSIITAKLLDHTYSEAIPSEMVIQGYFPSLFVGDVFRGIGTFVLHQTHGYSIKLKGYPVATLPQVQKGIAEFIKKRVKGLGMVTAKRIVEALGMDAISLIEKDYKCLLSINGISETRAKKIHEKIAEHRKFEDVAMFVQANGLENSVALKVYEAFKDDSIIKIKENPYCISSIPKLDFTQADKFAYNLNLPFDNYERIKSAILYYIDYFMKNYGDICIYKEDMMNRFSDFLIKLGSFPESEVVPIKPENIEKAIHELTSKEKIVPETNNEGHVCLYRKDYNVIENNIVRNLKKMLTEFRTPFCSKAQITEFLEDYEAKYFKLADNQRKAVYTSLSNGISILTGGPGTGKTQTTNTIVQCILHVKPHARIVLLAPTGKASRRMTELTSKEASTIHRGIGLNGFTDGEELEDIDADFVIVDESSMIDAYVFFALISHISENTRVMFVGDYEQLPSVGPGLILRDLINSERIPVTKLDKIFRQAESSQIVMNSHRIIKGDKKSLTFDNTKGDFYFIETRDKLNVKHKIIDGIDRLIKNQGYTLNDICVLSPIRKGDIGVEELNRIIQRKFNPPSNKKEYYIDNMNCFRVGDRVMHTRNNYDIQVMNGDVGEIVNISGETGDYTIEVQYPDKSHPVEYSEAIIDELELSFAMTIHKSQGSEFPVVIMPVHSSFTTLNKNLVYTGLTRAKQKAIMVGNKEALFKAMEIGDGIDRKSRIKEKIQKELPPLAS